MANHPSKFFTEKQLLQIFEATQVAELKTSGEIRIHIENHCTGDVLERAKQVFDELYMSETEEKNGVLIYLAILDKKFSIIGDEGIDKVTPDDIWSSIRDIMQMHFKKGEFTEGLVEAILTIGEKLVEFFPYANDDVNELSDEISFYDN